MLHPELNECDSMDIKYAGKGCDLKRWASGQHHQHQEVAAGVLSTVYIAVYVDKRQADGADGRRHIGVEIE